jgi:hypothetical protein
MSGQAPARWYAELDMGAAVDRNLLERLERSGPNDLVSMLVTFEPGTDLGALAAWLRVRGGTVARVLPSLGVMAVRARPGLGMELLGRPEVIAATGDESTVGKP